MNTFISEIPEAIMPAAATHQLSSSTVELVPWNGHSSSASVNEYTPDEELTEQDQMDFLHTFITYQQQGPEAFTSHEEFMKELFDG